MTKRAHLLPALLTLGAIASAGPTLAEEKPAGQIAFVELKCNTCHPVASLEIERTGKSDRMKGPDLSTVGDEREADWLKLYLLKEADLDGDKHQLTFRGDEQQLDAIVAWLVTLVEPVQTSEEAADPGR